MRVGESALSEIDRYEQFVSMTRSIKGIYRFWLRLELTYIPGRMYNLQVETVFYPADVGQERCDILL